MTNAPGEPRNEEEKDRTDGEQPQPGRTETAPLGTSTAAAGKRQTGGSYAERDETEGGKA